MALTLLLTLSGCSDSTLKSAGTEVGESEPPSPNLDISTPEVQENALPELVWNVSLWGKPRAGTEVAEALARELATATNGAWEVKLHYGEALSKSRENLDGLAIGAFESALFCNFYHPKKTPALMVLTMPFLPMESWENNRRAREAVYSHPDVIAEVKNWGAMIYTSTFLPQYEFMGRGDPPLEIEDWRGMTLRAGGGIGEAMLRLGATPTSSTATEVYTGVQQGTMNAASFPFTYGHVSYRIHEVSDWFTANLAPGSADCALAFSISAFEALPNVYKKLLEDVKNDVIEAQIQAYIDVDEINLPMLEESLVKIEYTESMRTEIQQTAGKPVIDAWIEENQGEFDAQGLVDAIYTAVERPTD